MARSWHLPVLGVLAAALLAAVGVLVVRQDNGAVLTAGKPEIVTADQLSKFAGESNRQIYWLGPMSKTRYELTETRRNRVYIRYLEGDAQVGDRRAGFVAVGTYPARNGVSALRRAARRLPGARLARTDDGAVLLVDPSSPKNAHLAYPDADSQVEVYSPVPGQALRSAARGEVQTVP